MTPALVRLPAVEHNFTGPAFTIGIEEELMILDAESLDLVNAIETMLEPAASGGEIKPELMESVLEVSTDPCASLAEAGTQLRALRGQVAQTAASKQMVIGSAGTHPFAMWENQRIVARPRYRDLIAALRFVARVPSRPDLLMEVAQSPKWVHRPRVRLALVLNPHSAEAFTIPLTTAVSFLLLPLPPLRRCRPGFQRRLMGHAVVPVGDHRSGLQ